MAENLRDLSIKRGRKGWTTPPSSCILRSSGWKEREIAEAFATRELAMPIPQRPGVGSARDTFFHLLAFTALYTAAISLIVSAVYVYRVRPARPSHARNQLGNWNIRPVGHPPVVGDTHRLLSAVLSGLVVFAARNSHHPDTAKTGLRRWLTSLSLFVGAVTIMTDVICVVYRLVEGDLTLRFLLKVLALLVVTGALFVYLALDSALRIEGPHMSLRLHAVFTMLRHGGCDNRSRLGIRPRRFTRAAASGSIR